MITKDDARRRLAGNVRRIRLQLGLTQTELSQLSGMDQAAISRLERGQLLPNPADLANLAEALNSTTDALLRTFQPLAVPA